MIMEYEKNLSNTGLAKKSFYLLILLFILTSLSENSVVARESTDILQVDITSLHLVERNRVGRTHLDYVYSINIHNTAGKDANNVTAQVSSSQNSAEIIQSVLDFSGVAAGEIITSQNEFIVRVPRRKRVDVDALSFAGFGDFINQAPSANAGLDQTVFIGDTVQLDGSASSDEDGDQLQYQWILISQPQSSQAFLSSANTLNPHFIVDLPGTYQVQLLVHDGMESSAPSQVVITTQNTRPVADAGPDQSVFVGDSVQLDGINSEDFDSDPLSFRWSLPVKPAGSEAVLNNASLIDPVFTIDLPGSYHARLLVNDGIENSNPNTVVITTQNSRPVANAGIDQTAFVGEIIELDGQDSSDADHDNLSYTWSLISRPSNSVASIASPLQEKTHFTADTVGIYVAQLIVRDTNSSSDPDTSRITVEIQSNKAPIANAGTNQSAIIGQKVTLDGSASSDPDGDAITFHWILLKPSGSNVSLSQPTTKNPQFTPDIVGSYSAQLIINDGIIDSTADNIEIMVTRNDSPVIQSVAIRSARVGEAYVYKVNASDANGHSLNYSLLTFPENMTIDGLSGQINWLPSISGTYNVIIQVDDLHGGKVEQLYSILVSEPVDETLPPDPATIAPELNPTEFTSLADSTTFLYSGENPIQTGVATDTIKADRVAIIRGEVQNNANQPLTGVTISVKGHPEFGQTISRADGLFDMVVNGGGRLTINYSKVGYLPVQRKVQTPWAGYRYAERVVMIPLDTQATVINLTDTSQPFQVAQGSVQTDAEGSRRATVLFPQGTSATIKLSDGSTQILSSITFRATEYTVGENGSDRMPGPLPPSSGYTYAVELSIDEAIAAGSDSVTFNQKVPFYVDNFLDFPVGEIVPVGFYNRAKAAWISSPNGKIIKIVSISNGIAQIDINGDNVADTGTALTDLGITLEEKVQLATLYTTGKSLWRVQIEHLTPWDLNWPYGPPEDAEFPPKQAPKTDKDEQPEEPDEDCGCIIEVESQVLGEDFPVTGSEMSLHYRSNRAFGYTSNQEVSILLSGDTVPESLLGIRLVVEVAGTRSIDHFPPVANQKIVFTWDGVDSYGRYRKKGTAKVTVEYLYQLQYYEAPIDFKRSFAIPRIGGRIIGTREEGTISTQISWDTEIYAEHFIPPSTYLGGLSLSQHHAYNSNAHLFVSGDGRLRRVKKLYSVINTVATIPEFNNLPLESFGNSLASDAEGNLFFYDYRREQSKLYKLAKNGELTWLAGNGTRGYSGDGGLATLASLGIIVGIVVDEEGNIYLSDTTGNRIRRISHDGIISTIAGNGSDISSGDGDLAVLAGIKGPSGIALDGEGNLYIAERGAHKVRRISPDGIIITVAGSGARGFRGDGGLAINAWLYGPAGIAVTTDGVIYIADRNNSRIRRVTPEGMIDTYAGNRGQYLSEPYSVAVDAVGNLYISDRENRISQVSVSGIMTTIAGGGRVLPDKVNTFPSTSVRLGLIEGITVNPKGNIVFIEDESFIHELSPFIDVGSVISKNGNLLYIFDEKGHHLETRNTLNNQIVYHFSYETNGYLSSIIDVDGNITNIERLADGAPVAIIAPDGERTEITLDENGYAKILTNPAGETHQLSYLDGGLLDIYTDPNGNIYDYDYDAKGRLINDKSPTGAGWELAITEQTQNSRTITKTSKEGRQTTYKSENLLTKDFKRTITSPNGTTFVTLEKLNGETQTILADGTVGSLTQGPDPRFGMLAPLPNKTTTSLPSGLQSTNIFTRAVTLSDPADKLSLTQQTDTLTQNGKSRTIVYDAINKTFTSTSAQGRTGITQLNDQGHQISSQITDLNSISIEYDSRGRATRMSTGMGLDLRETAYHYYESGDMKGYLKSITNALGEIGSFAYDQSGRVTRQTLPDNRQVNYQYDANGNLMGLTPAGRPMHAFNYDGLDQIITYLPPELVNIADPITTYQYNKDRQVSLITRPDGKTIAPVYSLITNRLERLITPQGETHYSYHASSGKLNQIITTDNQQLDYTFDGFLPKNTIWVGDINGRISQSYNNDFNLISRTINGTHSINYSYDHDQLLIQVGDLTLSREAQKGGLLNGTALGLLTTSQSYTGFAELKNSKASYNGTEQISWQYSYDKLSRIKSKLETIAGESHQYEYAYDLSGRLISIKKDALEIESYTYDSNSNRTHKNGIQIASYDNQDRLLTYQNNSYSYTENGELKTKTNNGATTSYNYDTLGNLRQVTLPGDMRINYIIDGENRRIGKKVNGTITQGFLYKDQINPIAELNANNDLIARFIYAEKGHVPSYLIKIDPVTHVETTFRIISDHLGSPKLIINIADGSIAQQMDYDTWGNIIQDTNPGFQPFGFAGGIYDQHTELIRFGVRDYDAVTGRWTVKDPVRFAGEDANLYGYVLGNPLNFVDPQGKSWQGWARIAVAVVTFLGGGEDQKINPHDFNDAKGERLPLVGEKVHADRELKTPRSQKGGILGKKIDIPAQLLSNGVPLALRLAGALNLVLYTPSIGCGSFDCNNNGIPDTEENQAFCR